MQPEDIDDCFEHADERIRKQQLQSLSEDHHVVYQYYEPTGLSVRNRSTNGMQTAYGTLESTDGWAISR